MSVGIRQATIDDSLEIVRMAHRFLATPEYAYAQLFKFNADHVADLVVKVLTLGVIWVAEVVTLQRPEAPPRAEPDTKLVAMLAVVAIVHPISGESFVEEIAWWVEPEHRHGTIGPRLIHKMEDWARAKGLHLVKMAAPVEAADVARFYISSGYRPIETNFAKRL
jgi:GNAT superfamily N-acetyltransferase